MDRTVKDTITAPVPVHLQDHHYPGADKLGTRTVGYKYAHDYPNHYVKQQYLPDGLTDRKFYVPSENGYEKKIRKYLKFLITGGDHSDSVRRKAGKGDMSK
jgi:putative ATPase